MLPVVLLGIFSPSLQQFPRSNALISTQLNTFRHPSYMSEIPSLRSSLLTGVLSRDFQLPQTTSAQGASMAPPEYPFSDVWTGRSRGSKLEQTQGSPTWFLLLPELSFFVSQLYSVKLIILYTLSVFRLYQVGCCKNICQCRST